MTREETKAAIAVMQHYADGGEVEGMHRQSTEWCRCVDPCWAWGSQNYRIKPTPKLRPWKLDEVPVGAVVRRRHGLGTRAVITQSCKTSEFGCVVVVEEHGYSADGMMSDWTMDDGSPCGKVVDK